MREGVVLSLALVPSVFVYAPMIAAGASPLSVILTTYVVNMRHYLMAATLAPSFGAFSRRRLALIAHVVNDESFAVAVSRSRPPDAAVFLGSAAAIFVAFVGGVTVGTLIGGLVAEPERYGLDLVATQLRHRRDWLVAVGSALAALAIAVRLPGNWHIIIAGLTVSGAGALFGDPEDTA